MNKRRLLLIKANYYFDDRIVNSDMYITGLLKKKQGVV